MKARTRYTTYISIQKPFIIDVLLYIVEYTYIYIRFKGCANELDSHLTTYVRFPFASLIATGHVIARVAEVDETPDYFCRYFLRSRISALRRMSDTFVLEIIVTRVVASIV